MKDPLTNRSVYLRLRPRYVAVFFIVAVILSSVWIANAGQDWTEIKYYVPNYRVAEKLPKPQSDWKESQGRRVRVGKNAASVEILVGKEKGNVTWIIGRLAIEQSETGEAYAFLKKALQASEDDGPITGLPDVSWTKTLEPIHKIQDGEVEVLVFDRLSENEQSPKVRVWISKTNGMLLAMVSIPFVTIFEYKKDPPDTLQVPGEVAGAIKDYAMEQEKAAGYGMMPIR